MSGRDPKTGRFTAGNATGRAAGVPNRTTLDLRLIRNSIVATWDQVDGNKRLIELARDDFGAYCKLVFPLLPKGLEIEERPFIRITEHHDHRAVGFMAHAEKVANGQPLTPELIVEALQSHQREEYHESQLRQSQSDQDQ